MAEATVFSVSTYRCYLSRRMGYDSYAVIICRGDGEGEQLRFYFMRPDSPPRSNRVTERGTGIAFLPVEQYSWYVDLLRNESPVFARVHHTEPIRHALMTGREAPGEGE